MLGLPAFHYNMCIWVYQTHHPGDLAQVQVFVYPDPTSPPEKVGAQGITDTGPQGLTHQVCHPWSPGSISALISAPKEIALPSSLHSSVLGLILSGKSPGNTELGMW